MRATRKRFPTVFSSTLALVTDRDPRIGRILKGTYRVRRLLGQGGMGTVYEAGHVFLPTRYAIKFLTGGLNDEDLYRRFVREAEIAARLGSRHAVRIYDFAIDDDRSPYMVMELLLGTDVSRWLDARGRATPEELLTILAHLRAALDPAHKAGVVHRDLKPENLFYHRTEEGEIVLKVMDFGVSKIRHSASLVTRDSAVLGTPAFMAPEQATGRGGEVDARADLFAIGSILYRALTGEMPFRAPSAIGVMFKITAEEPQPIREIVPDVPQAIADVVVRAMRKDKEERYGSVGELCDAWQAALGAPPPDTRSIEAVRGFVEEALARQPKTGEEEPVALAATLATPAESAAPRAVPPSPSQNLTQEQQPWHRNTKLLVAISVIVVALVLGAVSIVHTVKGPPEPPRSAEAIPFAIGKAIEGLSELKGAQAAAELAVEADEADEEDLPDKSISVSLVEADLDAVLRFFAECAEPNVNIMPDADVRTEPITVRLKDVPWNEAFKSVLRSHGLWFEQHGNIVRVARKGVLEHERSEPRRLQLESAFARAQVAREQAAQAAQQAAQAKQSLLPRRWTLERTRVEDLMRAIPKDLLSPRGTITPQGKNGVLVRDVPARLEAVERYLHVFDGDIAPDKAGPMTAPHAVPPVPPMPPTGGRPVPPPPKPPRGHRAPPAPPSE